MSPPSDWPNIRSYSGYYCEHSVVKLLLKHISVAAQENNFRDQSFDLYCTQYSISSVFAQVTPCRIADPSEEVGCVKIAVDFHPRICCQGPNPMRVRNEHRRVDSECFHEHHSKRPRSPIHVPAFNSSVVLLKTTSCEQPSEQQSCKGLRRQVSTCNWHLRKPRLLCPFPLLFHSPSSINLQFWKAQPNHSHLYRRSAFFYPTGSPFISPLLPKDINARANRVHLFRHNQLRRILTTKATIDPATSFSASNMTAFVNTAFDVNQSDVTLTGAIMTIVFGWLALWQVLTSQKLVPSIATRKVFHLTCGPAFVALWPLYSNSPTARLTAASVPLLFGLLLVISGLSADENVHGSRGMLGRMLSRGGNARDALQGPFYYTLVLLALTVLLFKSVIAAIAVTQLCFGDAMAEIVGRRFGAQLRWPLPRTGNKSVAGSFAFVLAALIGSIFAIQWYHYCECSSLQMNDLHVFIQIAIVSVTCSAAELASTMVSLDDNLAISTVAVILCIFMFGTQV